MLRIPESSMCTGARSSGYYSRSRSLPLPLVLCFCLFAPVQLLVQLVDGFSLRTRLNSAHLSKFKFTSSSPDHNDKDHNNGDKITIAGPFTADPFLPPRRDPILVPPQGIEEGGALEKAVRVPRKGRKYKIKRDEKVIFFPTAACRSEDGESWLVPIHGWIFEPETRDLARRGLVQGLRKYLKLPRNCEESRILKRRVGMFLVDNEKRKRLSIQIGNDEHARERRVFAMPKSCKNGHFECELVISDDELKEFKDEYPDHLLHFRAVTEEGDDRVFEGVAHLIDPQGWSVISDIDDTVKITYVGSKRRMLRSTFMEEFKEVKGMAEKYRQWEEELDAKFHFVSSSPWQLWEEIDMFLARSGFPLATYHLKPIRLKDKTLFDLWKDPVKTKTETIASILEEYPQRLFVLVGDTGEKDPEVYGSIARRFPQRIKGIFLRNVDNDTGKEERYSVALDGVDPSIVKLFHDPAEIDLSPEVMEAYWRTHPRMHTEN